MAGATLVCAAALLAMQAAAFSVKIGIVEEPERAAALAAAVRAGGGAALRGALEPGEAAAAAGALLCALAAEGAHAALATGAGRAARGAAARAGLPLLLAAPAEVPRGATVLQLYPHYDLFAEAARDVAREKGWRRAVLLYDEGGQRAAMLAAAGAAGAAGGAAGAAAAGEGLRLEARALPPPHDEPLLRDLLLVLKKSGARDFIVWCGAARTAGVLDAAQRVGLLDARHSYVLLAPDAHAARLDAYSHGGANVTVLRAADPAAAGAARARAAWRELGGGGGPMRAAELLAARGAEYAARALARLRLPPARPANCTRGAAGLHADTLLNYLRSEEWAPAAAVGAEEAAGAEGAALEETARWAWDGARRDAALQAAELARGGELRGVARWARGAGVRWARRDYTAAAAHAHTSMANRTFTIIIAQNPPYVMVRESTERLAGNDRYEGFCVELVQRLAQQLHFNYTFVEQEDRVYGKRDPKTRRWSGMLGRLIEDPSIDFAITDLTITAERQEAMDFTTPFMNLGISILYRTPDKPKPKLFAFMLPFSRGVWLSLLAAFLGTSLLLYAVGRLSPAEWQNPHPCVDDPPALANQFTLANALWFNTGAVLLQGSEIAPVAYSTRAVASVWWMFALVITSSYTANLATLLAKKSTESLISGAEDLARNTRGISYGAKAGGATYAFFEQSTNELYRAMFEHMRARRMPESNEAGVARVAADNFAFLMESTTIEYTTERNCDVTQVGKQLDNKAYGIAMKKITGDSPQRQALNLALLSLQEAGALRTMKRKWWKEMHGGGQCLEDDGRESEELTMANFLGLFLVLVVGSAAGAAAAAAQLALRVPRGPGYWRRLRRELRFVLRFGRSVKPLRLPSTPPPSPPLPAPPTPPAPAPPSPPPPASRRCSRRRSSLHAASVRRARHCSSSGPGD